MQGYDTIIWSIVGVVATSILVVLSILYTAKLHITRGKKSQLAVKVYRFLSRSGDRSNLDWIDAYALALRNTGDESGAIEQYFRCIHTGGAGIGVYFDLAELLEAHGEKKKAKAVLIAASVVLPKRELSDKERDELSRKLR